jgi:Tfp pilus assembly protein PilN
MSRSTRIVVLEGGAGAERHVLHAEIAGQRMTVLAAWTLAPGDPPGPAMQQAVERSERLLALDSDKAVCRLLALPRATDDQTRRLVANRLQVDLPYPAEESRWNWARLPAEGADPAGRVLLVAAPAEELRRAQAMSPLDGRDCVASLLDISALAELGRAGGEGEATAVVALRRGSGILAVVRGGYLRYSRRLSAGGEVADGGLVEELDQCLHHYEFSDADIFPKGLLLAGEGAASDSIAEELSRRMGMPVHPLGLPPGVEIAGSSTTPAELAGRYAVCLGALLYLRRRRSGETVGSPALQERRSRLARSVRWRTAAGIAAVLLLSAALIASLFVMRRARIASADRLMNQGRVMNEELERLQSEIAILERETAQRRPMLDILAALAEALPNGVRVTSVSIDSGGRVNMSGTCQSVEDISEKIINALDASPYFAKPQFLGASKDKKGGQLIFRVNCDLKKQSGGPRP